MTLSRHFSRSFIASGRTSGLHHVSSHSCCMYVRAGRPAFARPYVGVYRSTSLMSSSLLLQQCPACLVRLTWIVFVMRGRWPLRAILNKSWRQHPTRHQQYGHLPPITKTILVKWLILISAMFLCRCNLLFFLFFVTLFDMPSIVWQSTEFVWLSNHFNPIKKKISVS